MHHVPRSFSWLRTLAGAGVLALGALALTGCPPPDPNAACIPGAPPAGVTCASGDTCNAVQVSAGGNGTCAVVGPSTQCRDAAGVLTAAPASGTCATGSTTVYVGSEVRCWGQLNNVTAPTVANTPTTMQIGPQAASGAQRVQLYRKVVVGPNGYTCAIDVGGNLSCWGQPIFEGYSFEYAYPVNAEDARNPLSKGDQSLPPAIEVAIGTQHACALVGDQVACWHGRQAPEFVRSVAGDLTGARQIAAGTGHTCAVKTDGSVWCWGQRASAELLGSPGSLDDSYLARQVFIAPGRR